MKRIRRVTLAAAIMLVAVLGLILPACANAQRSDTPPAVDGGTSSTPVSLSPYLEILRDPQGKLTIDQVAAPSFTGFAPNGVNAPNFGYTTDAAWARFTVRNPSDTDQEYYVQLAAPAARFVDFYAPGATPGAFTPTRTGWDPSTSRRPVPSAYFVFPVTVPAQSQGTYYLRVTGDTGPVQLPLSLMQEDAFETSRHAVDSARLAVVGGLWLMGVYGLLLFFVLRERNYLLLGLFAAVYGVFVFGLSDAAFVWLGPGFAATYWQLNPIVAALTLVTYLAFCDAFLELRQRLLWAHRVTLGMMALCVAALALIPFGRVGTASLAEVVIGLFTNFAIPVFAFWVWRLGYKPAGYFFGAMLLPVIGSLIANLGRLGAGNWEGWYQMLSPAGTLALILVSALVMADRINELRREASRNARRLGEYLDAIPVGVAVYDPTQRAIYINAAAKDLTGRRPRPDVTYAEATRAFPAYVAGADTLYPYDKLPLIQAFGGQNASADDLEIEVHGQRVALEAWAHPLRDESDAVEAVVTTFLDITERRHREAELEAYRYHLEELVDERTEAERHEREIAEALQHTATALAGSLNMEGVVEIVLQQLSRVTAYKGALVALLDNHDLIVVGANGLCAPALRYREPMAAQAPAAEALRAAREKLCDQFLPPTNGATTQPAVLDVPLVNQGQTLGVLVVVTDWTNNAEPDTDNVIQAFADQAALAVANARLYRQAKLAAAAEEREMLARELHDAVTQTLCSANLLAGTALGLWADAPPAARRPIEDVQWMLNGAVAEMRTLLLELRPWALAASPLEAVLPPLFDAFTGRTHVPVDFCIDIEASSPSPEDVTIAVYRIAQETLNNIDRHAGATCVTAHLYRRPGCVRLSIRDDGRGFDPAAVTSDHMGLDIMRERAEEAGLALTLTSRVGDGACLRVEWMADDHDH